MPSHQLLNNIQSIETNTANDSPYLENLPTEIFSYILFFLYKNHYGFFESTFFALRRASKTLKNNTDDFLYSSEFKRVSSLKVNGLKSLLELDPTWYSPGSVYFFRLNSSIDGAAKLYYSAIIGDENFWSIFNKESLAIQKQLLTQPLLHLTVSSYSNKVTLLSLLIYYGHSKLVSQLQKKIPLFLNYQQILAADNHDAFFRACVCGDIELVKLLWEQCEPQNRQKMLRGSKKHPYLVFSRTARVWNPEILKLLIQFCEPSNQHNLMKAEGYLAVSCACAHGDDELLDLFLKCILDKHHIKMLATGSHAPLRWAIMDERLSTVKKLFFLYPPEIRQIVLENQINYRKYVKSIPVLHFLIDQWSNPQKVPQPLSTVLFKCSLDETLFDKIIKKFPLIILQNELRYRIGDIFMFYCSEGKSSLVKKLFNLCESSFVSGWSGYPPETKQKALVENHGYWAFRKACESGDYETIQVLFELCDADKKQEMIAACNYNGFRTLCYNENLMGAALIFSHASGANLNELKKIAGDPYPAKDHKNQPVKHKIVNTDLTFLFLYRNFMQSILSGKKIEILSEAKTYMWGQQGFFNKVVIRDKTRPDPYHSWAIAKL
jgi:hypothetical protein